jgi:hypothetical protein
MHRVAPSRTARASCRASSAVVYIFQFRALSGFRNIMSFTSFWAFRKFVTGFQRGAGNIIKIVYVFKHKTLGPNFLLILTCFGYIYGFGLDRSELAAKES